MVRRYQIRLMRSVNARCVSIGLVLALSNCSESGGEPDAMLDMHHPGTGIDSHHPQFHNSYGNMKFIIIVINPTLPPPQTRPSARLKIPAKYRFSRSQRFPSFSRRRFERFFSSLCPFRPRAPLFYVDNTTSKFRTTANFFDEETREMGRPFMLKNYFSFPPLFIIY